MKTAAQMTELLSELEEKRGQANAQADVHRRKRDELNDKTKEWIRKRDELNSKVRELIDEAQKHKSERDRLNEAVQVAKTEREKWNKKVVELLEEYNKVKRRKVPRGGVPVEKLKRDLHGLEFKQQTSVLTVDKERDLIDQIAHLQGEIKKREIQLQEDADIKALQQQVEEARKQAESFHQQVGQVAEEAQTHHDSMVSLYDQADAVREEADRAQEEFIKSKMLADEKHQKHIEFIRQVHDYDKIIHGIRAKDRRARIEKAETTAKREAEQIYEKFKKGEKLSTEDLMVLQKSGYL